MHNAVHRRLLLVLTISPTEGKLQELPFMNTSLIRLFFMLTISLSLPLYGDANDPNDHPGTAGPPSNESASADDGQYDHGVEPTPPTPFPAAFKNYQILPNTISPNQQYALIYPKKSALYDLPHHNLYLAALKPFRIIAQIPLNKYTTLAINSNDYYDVNWAKDSSAVDVIEGIKWGPDEVYVIPLHDGHAGKIGALTEAIRRILEPDFHRAKATPYSDTIDFIFVEDDDEFSWKINERGQVIVVTSCESHPNLAGHQNWTATFNGIWDISKRRFLSEHVSSQIFKLN